MDAQPLNCAVWAARHMGRLVSPSSLLPFGPTLVRLGLQRSLLDGGFIFFDFFVFFVGCHSDGGIADELVAGMFVANVWGCRRQAQWGFRSSQIIVPRCGHAFVVRDDLAHFAMSCSR